MVETQAGPPVDDHANHVLTRIDEFVDVGTPWHRALWSAGTVLSLRELVEYGEQLQSKVIATDQVKEAASAALQMLPDDSGLPANILASVSSILSAPADMAKEATRHQLTHLTRRLDDLYLARWADDSAQPQVSRTRPERAARHLASHLLDTGLSQHRIKVLTAQVADAPNPLVVFCEKAAELLSRDPAKQTVIVPLTVLPELFVRHSDIDSRRIAVLPTRDDLLRASPREWHASYAAGLSISVKERDPWSAVQAARDLVSRLQARLSVSRDAAVLELPLEVAVVGEEQLFNLDADRRPIRVPALDRSRKTLQVGGYAEADALDDALELLSTLGSGTPGAALTNGWASIEGLLVGATEKGILAAERLATIVALDWPRSELTWLANAPAKQDVTDPGLFSVLKAKGKNSVGTKVDALENALRDSIDVGYSRPRDVAALHRLRALVADPAGTVAQVRFGLVGALRRLYVQRNLVMHAGSFKSVARSATLRTVPAIAAAGMDRLVHAADQGITPLMLAARAEVELDLLPKGGTGRPLAHLLD